MEQKYRANLKDSVGKIEDVMFRFGYLVDYTRYKHREEGPDKLFFGKLVKGGLERCIILREDNQHIILMDYGHVFDSAMENILKSNVRLGENPLKSEEELLEQIRKATGVVDGQYLPDIEKRKNY